MEVGISRSLGLQSFGGACFYLQNKVRWRAGARVSDQEVNVVGDRAHLEQRSLLIFNNATQVSVEFMTNIVGQCRFPVLRGEDQMHQDLGERLRHEFRPFRAPVLLGVNRWLRRCPSDPGRCPSDPGRCPGLSHHAALRHLGSRCVNAGWLALDIFAIGPSQGNALGVGTRRFITPTAWMLFRIHQRPASLAATRPNTKAQGNALGVAMRRLITKEIDCAFA